MEAIIQESLRNFEQNVDKVYKLIDFDKVILDFTIDLVDRLNQRLKKRFGAENPRFNADNTLKALSNVRQNDSMRENYQTIFNQCIVLLVSYFGAAVRDIFAQCLFYRLSDTTSDTLRKREIRISLGELQEMDFDLAEEIGTIMVNKEDISFQDMGSIHKAFSAYFDFCPERNHDVDNIILAQACRHAIVHAGGTVDKRLIKQIQDANQRDIKKILKEGQAINFAPSEIEVVGRSMIDYMRTLSEGILS